MLEYLVSQELVVRVYEQKWRIDRKPAYYFLSKSGVTFTRKLLDVKETAVNPLYKNDQATTEFIQHCLDVTAAYPVLKGQLPEGTGLLLRPELHRFETDALPRNKPDLLIQTPDGKEAMVVFVHDVPPYIARKRRDEIITHNEDEGWEDGDYPRVAFVVKDERMKYKFLRSTFIKLDDAGFIEEDLQVIVASLGELLSGKTKIWASVYNSKADIELFG